MCEVTTLFCISPRVCSRSWEYSQESCTSHRRKYNLHSWLQTQCPQSFWPAAVATSPLWLVCLWLKLCYLCVSPKLVPERLSGRFSVVIYYSPTCKISSLLELWFQGPSWTVYSVFEAISKQIQTVLGFRWYTCGHNTWWLEGVLVHAWMDF